MNCPFFITITALLTGTLTQNVPAGYFPLPGLPNLLRKPKKQKPAEDPMKSVELAKGVLTTFFSAGTVEEMAKHVRNPERALPRMKAYYGDTKPAPIKITFTGDWREVERGKSVLLLTTLQIDFKKVPLVVEVPEKDGPAKVDWEAFVGWCAVPWAEFVKKGSEKPAEFRVAATPGDYFNFNFADSKKYACFRLVDGGDTETVFAYCERESELYKKLAEAFPTPEPDQKQEEAGYQTFILKLSMKEGDAAHHQALIKDIICEGWVEP